MNISRKKKQNKRDSDKKYPKNKTFDYRSARSTSNDKSNQSRHFDKSENSTKRTSSISKILNVILFLSILVSFVYLSSVDTKPVIHINSSILPRDSNVYENAVSSEMNSSLLYKNKLTFNPDKFEENIKNSFPEVDDLTIEIPIIRHRPIVNISLSEPVARLVTNNNNYILDVEGRALFEESLIDQDFDTSSLVSINDVSNHPVELGKPVLTRQQIQFVKELLAQSKAKKTPVDTLVLEPGGSTLEVNFKDSRYIVKFSFYEDVTQSSGAYFAIRKRIDSKEVPNPSQYIDLRIPDRAYIK